MKLYKFNFIVREKLFTLSYNEWSMSSIYVEQAAQYLNHPLSYEATNTEIALSANINANVQCINCNFKYTKL